MRTADFDYELPPEFIAQQPAHPRDSSRLMVVKKAGGVFRHHRFNELADILHPGDTLVFNETRVLPARLNVRKQPGGGRAELLLLERVKPQTWQALVGGKGLSTGRELILENGMQAKVLEELDGPRRLVHFAGPITDLLAEIGEMPLPPYITTPLRDPEDYQTVFSRVPGSSAAPTAGLHFTTGVLDSLMTHGVKLAFVTLHIGLDTFAPVREEDPRQHTIHSEWCSISSGSAEKVNAARSDGGRIIAVGTTAVRTLETAAGEEGTLQPYEGKTDLFILPGYGFKTVDAMITNFHLPRSTLIMLVSAFAGRERIMNAYAEAMAQGYRFYSFGDAMLIE